MTHSIPPSSPSDLTSDFLLTTLVSDYFPCCFLKLWRLPSCPPTPRHPTHPTASTTVPQLTLHDYPATSLQSHRLQSTQHKARPPRGSSTSISLVNQVITLSGLEILQTPDLTSWLPWSPVHSLHVHRRLHAVLKESHMTLILPVSSWQAHACPRLTLIYLPCHLTSVPALLAV